MLRAIIFDMDGVLVNSIGPIWKSFNKILKDEGVDVDFSEEYIKENLARSLRDNLRAWKTEFGIKDYDAAEFSKKAWAIQFESIKHEKINPDLLNLLKEAKENNIPCAVATSSISWRAEKILELLNVRSFFCVLISADDIKNHKPAPDVFLAAAQQLAVDPRECVVIEDAGNGIAAAKSANMKTIGLLTKYYSADKLKQADLIIKDFSELSIEKIKKTSDCKRGLRSVFTCDA